MPAIDPELYEERVALVQEGCGWSPEEAEAFCRTLFQSPEPAPLTGPLARGSLVTEPASGLALRPYQAEAVAAVLEALSEGEHPVVNLPTGSGKSLVIAALCAQLPGRILVVTHRKRLIQQNSAQLARYGLSPAEIGVYSAGLRQRDTRHRVLFAGRDSIAHRMPALQAHGDFDYIIVDEAHLVAPPSTESQYARIFRACPPGSQRIGLSATPSRMGTPIWGDDDAWFSTCAYTARIDALTTAGYLTPMATVLTARDIDLSAVKVQAGEFVVSQASAAMSERQAAEAALDEACQLAQHRQAWLVFCCDVAHTVLIADLLTQRGIACGMVHGQQSGERNDAALEAFEAGELRALVSCEMLTTGVDVPRVDCGILLRPTMSKELLKQMLGRLTRLSAGKEDALILDYAGNLARHGDLETTIATTRTAEREARDQAEREKCEQLEREEAERQARHRTSVLGDRSAYAVEAIDYSVGRPASHPERAYLRVIYHCPAHPRKHIPIFLCVEGYQGKARQSAVEWFTRRKLICPDDAWTARRIAERARSPQAIVVEEDGQFFRLVQEIFSAE
jgi:DNA repair protein RadD